MNENAPDFYFMDLLDAQAYCRKQGWTCYSIHKNDNGYKVEKR